MKGRQRRTKVSLFRSSELSTPRESFHVSSCNARGGEQESERIGTNNIKEHASMGNNNSGSDDSSHRGYASAQDVGNFVEGEMEEKILALPQAISKSSIEIPDTPGPSKNKFLKFLKRRHKSSMARRSKVNVRPRKTSPRIFPHNNHVKTRISVASHLSELAASNGDIPAMSSGASGTSIQPSGYLGMQIQPSGTSGKQIQQNLQVQPQKNIQIHSTEELGIHASGTLGTHKVPTQKISTARLTSRKDTPNFAFYSTIKKDEE